MWSILFLNLNVYILETFDDIFLQSFDIERFVWKTRNMFRTMVLSSSMPFIKMFFAIINTVYKYIRCTI